MKPVIFVFLEEDPSSFDTTAWAALSQDGVLLRKGLASSKHRARLDSGLFGDQGIRSHGARSLESYNEHFPGGFLLLEISQECPCPDSCAELHDAAMAAHALREVAV